MAKSLSEKSNENFLAAKLLFTTPNSYYSTSAHSIYYSIFQVLKHLILNEYSLKESDVLSKRKNGTNHLVKSEHDFSIEFIRKKLRDINEIFLARDLQTTFGELKDLRTEADYKEIEITLERVKKAHENASILLTKIRAKFNF